MAYVVHNFKEVEKVMKKEKDFTQELVFYLNDFIIKNYNDFPKDIKEEIHPDYLVWMCGKILENLDIWPVHKAHRWIGYIQGVLITLDISTVSEQKEETRKILNRYDLNF